MGGQAWCPHSSVLLALPTALLCLLEPLDVSAGVLSVSSGREGVWARPRLPQGGRHGSQLLSPPPRAGVGRRDLCWVFQETPTKELGHCGGAARSPERSSPAPAAGSPHLSRGLNSESSTDEEGTALGGPAENAAEDPRGVNCS